MGNLPGREALERATHGCYESAALVLHAVDSH
jgi:hypothetical protein